MTKSLYRSATLAAFALCFFSLRGQLTAQTPRPLELDVPADRLEKYVLPPQDNQLLLQQELDRRQKGRAPRFAQALPVQITPDRYGRWDESGDLAVWRLRLHSPAAWSLNLGFGQYYLPEGGKLFLYDPAKKQVTGPFTTADNETHNELWTPVFPGDELVVEVQVPARRRGELQLELTFVNHDFAGFTQLSSGSCNLDIVCGAADGWEGVEPFRDVARSVGVYSVRGSLLCTGFLVNNSTNDCTPYFLTADHCEITNDNAPSVVVYWNFENSSCRQPNTTASGQDGDGQLDDFNTGAIFRAGWANSDFCLIELDDPVSESANAFFAGWSAEDQTPVGTVACIHHPFTDEKRISLSEKPIHFGFWGNNAPNAGGNHLIVPSWTTGTTQSGSSGAPLFNDRGQAIGQLHGGDAACGNSSYDAFGRLYNSWEGGGTPSSRLKDWLDPLNGNRRSMGGRDQSLCDFWIDATFAGGAVCVGSTDTLRIRLGPGFEEGAAFTLAGIPPAVLSSEALPGAGPGEVMYIWQVQENAAAGTYTFQVNTSADTAYFTFRIVAQAPQEPVALFPPDEADNQPLEFLLSWASQPDAAYYQLQLATDSVFSAVVIDQRFETDTAVLIADLSPGTPYFWRLMSGNVCGGSLWSETHRFTTANIQCEAFGASDGPINISGATTSTITSSVAVSAEGTVASIEIQDLQIQHRWVGDLRVSLQAPSGKVITLFDRPGFPASLYGCDGANLVLNFSQHTGADPNVLENTCNGAEPALAGTYRALESLAGFIGESAAGNWKLIVNDQAEEDGGQLIGWQLTICTGPEELPLLKGLADSYIACTDEQLTMDIRVGENFTGSSVTLTLDEVPQGASYLFSKNPAVPGDTVQLQLDNLLITGAQEVVISATDGSDAAVLALDVLVSAAPGATTPIEPEPGSTVSGNAITFIWTAAENALSYQLEVAADAEFRELLYSFETVTPTYTIEMPEAAGVLYWRVTSGNSCGAHTSDAAVFSFTSTDTSDFQDGQSVQLYPNPFSKWLNLRFAQPLVFPVRLRLLDVNGRQLMGDLLLPGVTEKRLDPGPLSAGVYLLEMQYRGRRYVQRILML